MKASLKEDAAVDNGIDITITLQPAQLVLIGTLLGILLLWMVIFAWLAIRPSPEKETGEMEILASSPGVIPTPVPVTARRSTIPSRPVTVLAQEAGGEVVLEGSRR